MELRSDQIVSPDDRGYFTRVIDPRQPLFRISAGQSVAMDEITMHAAGKSLKHRMIGLYDIQIVPAHMGNFQSAINWFDWGNYALYPPESLMISVFDAPLGHELHTDANAEKWLAMINRVPFQRIAHAAERDET